MNQLDANMFQVYSYVQLNMLGGLARPSSGAQQLQQQPLALPLERGGRSAVGLGRAGYITRSLIFYESSKPDQ
jgi:hypothetical protein